MPRKVEIDQPDKTVREGFRHTTVIGLPDHTCSQCGAENAFVRVHLSDGIDVWWGPACIQKLRDEAEGR